MKLSSTVTLPALAGGAKTCQIPPQGRLITFEGQTCILKQAQRKPWAIVRSGLAALGCWLAFGERIKPSALRTGGIEHEAQRLRQLHEAGRRVPRIRLQTQDCLVLENVGTSLDRIVPQLLESEKIALFGRMADDLADWHASGHWHGGAQLRNATLHHGQIYRIDFEERHGLVLSPSATRVYDLLLFLGDALVQLEARHVVPQGSVLMQRYLNRLAKLSDGRTAQAELAQNQAQINVLLERLLRLLQPLLWLDDHCPALTRRRDKQRVVRFARVMQSMLCPPRPVLQEFAAPIFKTVFADRLAHLAHQRQIKIQVVQRVQASAGNLGSSGRVSWR